jgi:hypothetical protein
MYGPLQCFLAQKRLLAHGAVCFLNTSHPSSRPQSPSCEPLCACAGSPLPTQLRHTLYIIRSHFSLYHIFHTFSPHTICEIHSLVRLPCIGPYIACSSYFLHHYQYTWVSNASTDKRPSYGTPLVGDSIQRCLPNYGTKLSATMGERGTPPTHHGDVDTQKIIR